MGRLGRPSDNAPCADPCVTTEELDGELVLYSEASEEIHCLNLSASLVWALCDGKRTVSEIVGYLAEATGAERGEVQRPVEEVLAEFRRLSVLL